MMTYELLFVIVLVFLIYLDLRYGPFPVNGVTDYGKGSMLIYNTATVMWALGF